MPRAKTHSARAILISDICRLYADIWEVGAGLTGITAGILLPAKVPGISLTIFEKNADVVSCADYLEMINF